MKQEKYLWIISMRELDHGTGYVEGTVASALLFLSQQETYRLGVDPMFYPQNAIIGLFAGLRK